MYQLVIIQTLDPREGVPRRQVLVGVFFSYFLIFFCFVVAIFDLVHYMEAIFRLLTASGNPFINMSDAAVFRASLIFQKRFPDAVSS